MQTLLGKIKTENKITRLIIAIWKGRIEFSHLTEFAFNPEQSLTEDAVSALAIMVDPGEAVIYEGTQRQGLCSRNSKQAGGSSESPSLKAGVHFSVSFFPAVRFH